MAQIPIPPTAMQFVSWHITTILLILTSIRSHLSVLRVFNSFAKSSNQRKIMLAVLKME